MKKPTFQLPCHQRPTEFSPIVIEWVFIEIHLHPGGDCPREVF
jgi:hypothetical protein